ncbi:hypothetical protein H4R19_006309 [Coemansia spiralis]|nr:hypothetical protein H4R19_006309 [Coemansia spiralis]
MLSTTFFGRFVHTSALDVADMPPADWCVTTLQTLTNKYEHLTSVRKANPPYAEAVLNSFKSKLLDVVSSHSLYDDDEASDGEAEWPLSNDCPSYMDTKPDTDTSNYHPTLTPAALADAASTVCFADDASGDVAMGLPSPSPSPPEARDAVDAGADPAADCLSFGAACELPAGLESALPSSIEDALRRFLANNSTQALGNTFSTFAGVCGGESESCAGSNQDCDELGDADMYGDGESAQYTSESDSSSLDSPDEMDPEFLAASTDGSLIPCKRKRNTDKDDQRAEAAPEPTMGIRLGVLPVSPRKRSRSAGHADTSAAVPSKPLAVAAAPTATA